MRNRFFVFIFLLFALNVYAQSSPLTLKISSSSPSICSGGAVVLTVSASGGIAPYTYIWNTGDTTSSITINKGGIYKVIVSDKTPGSQPVTAQIIITANPTPSTPIASNAVTCPNSGATLKAVAPGGVYQWYDAAIGGNFLATGPTFTTPPLANTTTYYVETTVNGCTSARTAVTAYLYSKPTVYSATVCQGSSAVLSASGADTYNWYASPSGGVVLNTSDKFITPPLVNTTTYYVVSTINGCVSSPTPVTAYVAQAPKPPVVPNTSVCFGGTVNLHATALGGVFDWFTDPDGGTSLISSPDFTTPPLTSTTTYYVQVTSAAGCVSARTPVTIKVDPILNVPVANDITTCFGTSALLTASGSGGTLQWFSSATSTTVLASGNSFNTPVLKNSTTYYVDVTNGGCSSPRAAVMAIVNPIVEAPTAAGLLTCSGSVVALTATSLGNGSYAWYDAAQGGNLLASTATFVTPPINSNTTFYVQTTVNGCTSARAPVVVSVLPVPATPLTYGTTVCTDNQIFTASGVTICSGGQALLMAKLDVAESNNWYEWYDAPTGGNLLTSDHLYITPPLTTTTTYYVQNVLNGCISARKPITVTVTPPGRCGTGLTTSSLNNGISTQAPTAVSVNVCMGRSTILSATAPGGCYQWYDAATGGNFLKSGPLYTTQPITGNTTYYVQTTLNGITSARTPVVVKAVAEPAAPIAKGLTVCLGNPAILTASGSPGTYAWYDAPAGGHLLSQANTYTTPYIIRDTAYYVQSVLDYYYCEGPRTKVSVIVHPVPSITSASTYAVCSGNKLNYSIQSNIASATFIWSRAAVDGISSPALNNQTSATINETLINTSDSTKTVTYTIIPVAGGCTGALFNLVVTVYPQPAIISAATTTICSGTSVNYQPAFKITGTSFNWSREAVPEIKNAAVTGQTAAPINEVLVNTGNKPINVTYVFAYHTNACWGPASGLVVTVNPTVNITSASEYTICSGSPQNYTITSNVSSATFSWSRVAVVGISNPGVTGQTLGTINESLINTTSYAIKVTYKITPTNNNCTGAAFKLSVTVNPQPVMPQANGNSPVCLGSSIELNATTLPLATYLWTGPGGFQSTTQNPVIENVSAANAGIYNLYTIINGCSSPASPVIIKVNLPPVTNAGPDQTVCLNANQVNLAGIVSGGTTTGIWTTNGSGIFSPASNVLNAKYLPSSQDLAAGAVTLTLSSTSPDNCSISTSQMTIKFQLLTGVKAGDNQTVCSQTNAVKLSGQLFAPGGGLWTTTGSGTFSPSASQLDATYIPHAEDIKNGKVTLTLHAVDAGECYTPADSLAVSFGLPPSVNAGGTRYVLKDNTIVLTPAVSDDKVQYLWSPDIDISSTTAKNPTITGNNNITYTLTVTDSLGCISQDQTNIVVSPKLTVPNTFTPNGDGINDEWNVTGLVAYQNAVIDVFDRYGQKVFHSIGYGYSWDGTCNGRKLPTGTYYYVIDVKLNGQIISGSLAIIR